MGIGFSEPMLVRTWLRFGPKKAFKLPQYSMSHVGMAASSLVAGVQVVPASVLIPITAEEKAAAPPMEPAMEALLRQANLHEDLIWKSRINELCDRELFVAIDRDEVRLRTGPRKGVRAQTRGRKSRESMEHGQGPERGQGESRRSCSSPRGADYDAPGLGIADGLFQEQVRQPYPHQRASRHSQRNYFGSRGQRKGTRSPRRG